MSDVPVLMPGDSIHIEHPQAMTVSQVHQMEKLYQSYGVTIGILTSSNAVDEIRIVAVFRNHYCPSQVTVTDIPGSA